MVKISDRCQSIAQVNAVRKNTSRPVISQTVAKLFHFYRKQKKVKTRKKMFFPRPTKVSAVYTAWCAWWRPLNVLFFLLPGKKIHNLFILQLYYTQFSAILNRYHDHLLQVQKIKDHFRFCNNLFIPKVLQKHAVQVKKLPNKNGKNMRPIPTDS